MRIIGVDIGGTKCTVSRIEENPDHIQCKQIPTSDFESTLSEICKAIAELGADSSPVFGISYGGPLDTKNNTLLPAQNLPGWERYSLVNLLTGQFGGKAFIMNDANAGALAEWYYGAARGYSNIIFLTFGTGMGAGIILDNRLYEGSDGLAGEIGHIRMAPDGPVGCGKAGSFEGFCSGGGLAQLARRKALELGGKVDFNPGSIEEITAKHVGLAAEKGDPAARELLAQSGYRLGMALSVLIDILNPQVIVLGGIYRRCQKFLEPSMREILQQETLPVPLKTCRIVPTELGDNIGKYSAISVALYRMGKEPLSI
ncbi:MAG TPA: ROK family protein [archaeon]|nr:ROK family protein [archaeon]